MKKFKNLLPLGLLAVLLVNGCAEQAQKSEEPTPTTTIEKPDHIISISDAKMLYDRYGERRVPIIQKFEDAINERKKDTTKFDVARYVSYDYKSLKEYLAYIDQEAQRANIEISSLRFYLSNYPDETFFPDSKDSISHPRQNSVMITPAISKGNRDYIYYIENIDSESPRAIYLRDSFNPMESQEVGLTETEKRAHAAFVNNLPASASALPYQGGGSMTYNRGTGAPPPYDEQ